MYFAFILYSDKVCIKYMNELKASKKQPVRTEMWKSSWFITELLYMLIQLTECSPGEDVESACSGKSLSLIKSSAATSL